MDPRKVSGWRMPQLDRGKIMRGERAVDALVLEPVSGVAAGQGAERHRSRHEAPVGVRFAGVDKQVHLIGLGERVPRLGRGVADRLYRPGPIGQGFSNMV